MCCHNTIINCNLIRGIKHVRTHIIVELFNLVVVEYIYKYIYI